MLTRILLLLTLGASFSSIYSAQSCTESAGFRRIGEPTTGEGAPRLTAEGLPVPGSTFGIGVEGGASNASGILFLGFQPQSLFLPVFGATVHLIPNGPSYPFQLDAVGRSGSVAQVSGIAASLCGTQVWFQAITFDGIASGGLAFSDGVALRFGGADSGTMLTEREYRAGRTLRDVVDVDGDGHLDLLHYDALEPGVEVLLGAGDGSFEDPLWSPLAVGVFGDTARVADVNGDGHRDLIYRGNDLNGVLRIAYGTGPGQFGAIEELPLPTMPVTVEVADANGDGIVDLFLGLSSVSQSWFTLLGNGDGTFVAGSSFGSGTGISSIQPVDLNEDGIVDALYRSGPVYARLGDGTGGFGPESLVAPAGLPNWVDVNGDGRVDLIQEFVAETFTTYLNAGDGTFTEGRHHEPGRSIPDALVRRLERGRPRRPRGTSSLGGRGPESSSRFGFTSGRATACSFLGRPLPRRPNSPRRASEPTWMGMGRTT